MKKVLCVFGTRPEAIKMAPVVLKFREYKREFRTSVVVTAQHRDMLDQVLHLFKIKSDYDLDIMRPGQTLTDVSVRAFERLEPVFKKEKPDLVLVHGDTTTALIASLAAFYQKIPVGHVEAGLRSHDAQNPFPEEINRRLADAVCTLHFAPTDSARKNLLRENISPKNIFVTGNTGIDALKIGVRGQGSDSQRFKPYSIPCPPSPFILITAHRRENFGAPLENFCRAVRRVAHKYPNVYFVYPVHPNPNVVKPVQSLLSKQPNIHLLPPLGYGDFLPLLQKALFVITDSGGIQEEAPSLGKPVLVFREVTERPEAVKAGTVRIMGTSFDNIHQWISRLLEDKVLYKRMANAVNPYGDGKAAERTVQAVRHHFGFRRSRPSEFKIG